MEYISSDTNVWLDFAEIAIRVGDETSKYQENSLAQ